MLRGKRDSAGNRTTRVACCGHDPPADLDEPRVLRRVADFDRDLEHVGKTGRSSAIGQPLAAVLAVLLPLSWSGRGATQFVRGTGLLRNFPTPLGHVHDPPTDRDQLRRLGDVADLDGELEYNTIALVSVTVAAVGSVAGYALVRSRDFVAAGSPAPAPPGPARAEPA